MVRAYLTAAVAIAAAGCERRSERRPSLTLTQVRPENHAGVFLNERIQLHFSEPLDPTSVHRRSVRITSTDGVPARGELYVAEERLTFVPEPVLAFDLSDGGYLPGTTYRVDLAGFPEVDGLRGRSGATLERNLRWEFRTVTVTEPRIGFVFEDSSLARGLRVKLRANAIQRGDPILLEGEEPLDPSTLFAEDFVLRRLIVEEQKGKVRPPMSAPIPLRVRLRENHDYNDPLSRGDPASRGTALIELTPVDRLLEAGSYWLKVDDEQLRLRDLGGNRLRWSEPMTFTVVTRASGPEEATWFLESFFNPSRRSQQSPEGFDGTALWSEGRVEVRWPQAAGDGSDGELVLAQREPRADVQAIRIEMLANTTCELDPAPGLVVLRAQGKLSIAGQLLRRGRDARDGVATEPPDAIQLFVGNECQGDRLVSTLSECLELARERNLDATILIAGGDLVIDGRIDSDRPVFLVAGGRIRAARADVVGCADVLHCLGDGGSLLLNRLAPSSRTAKAMPSQLELDAPQHNRLVAPLRWAVVSAPIPAEGRALRWHVAPEVQGDPGIGLVRVRYIGERVDASGRFMREVVVDDPAALTDCPTLRLQVEFDIPAGEGEQAWDPPWVDYVLVEFDRAAGSER